MFNRIKSLKKFKLLNPKIQGYWVIYTSNSKFKDMTETLNKI